MQNGVTTTDMLPLSIKIVDIFTPLNTHPTNMPALHEMAQVDVHSQQPCSLE